MNIKHSIVTVIIAMPLFFATAAMAADNTGNAPASTNGQTPTTTKKPGKPKVPFWSGNNLDNFKGVKGANNALIRHTSSTAPQLLAMNRPAAGAKKAKMPFWSGNALGK